MTLSSLLILAAIIFAFSFEFAGRKWGIAAIPTLPWQRHVMMQVMGKYFPTFNLPLEGGGNTSVIIELGCGWGGLIAAIHKRYQNAQIIGYEAYAPAAFCARTRFAGKANIIIRTQDFFTADLSSADVVVCYLSHDLMRQLQPKFQSELKTGAVVISNAFPLPDWPAVDHIVTRAIVPLHVWVYRKD